MDLWRSALFIKERKAMTDDSPNGGTARMRIEVEDKNMRAFLVFDEPTENSPPFTEEEIKNILEQSGVIFGIKTDVIKELIETNQNAGKILISEGVPPIAGNDASFEYYFKTDKSLKPKILEDGHTDYKEVNLVDSVTKDAILIKKTPPTQGINGTDVYGKEIHPLPGKDCDIIVGPGTYKDANDKNIIKSSADGIIFFNEKKKSIEVQKLYVVPKSVDFSTGNINVKSSVDIHGDVKQHFSVTTPYNIQVKGIIENATINCGGSLSALGGIVGDGKQLIEVTGDIHTSYITNQKIKCHGSIYVNTEIRNTFIDCDDEVIVVKDSGVIIGGRISATNKVTASSIGNAYFVPTEIEVGVKLEHKAKFHAKETEKNAMQKHVDDIKKEIADAEERDEEIGSHYLKNLKDRLSEFCEKLDILRKEFKEIETLYHDVSEAIVSASRRVYPGTVVKIKNSVFEVKEELNNVKFVYEGGVIKCINLK